MFCTHCGVSLGEAEPNFCPGCGKSTGANQFRGAYQEKRLVRPRDGRQIGGVCVGLANYLETDVTLVRLAALVAFFFSLGTGLVAYVIAMIVIPEEASVPAADAAETRQS